MCRSLIASLLVLLSVGGAFLQEQSVKEANAEIERRNDCKCIKAFHCDSNNNFNPFMMSFNGRANIPPIECKGERMRCCKPIPTNNTETVTGKGPNVVVPHNPEPSPSCGASLQTVAARKAIPDAEPSEEEAMDGEFPWLVAIFKKESSGSYDFRCGGTLIHPKVVLTAYHCVYKKKPSDVLVRATGKKELPTTDSDTRSVSEIVKHPNYIRHPRLYYDAVLLILDTPFAIGKTLNTLCLPTPNMVISFESCIVAGWGDRNGRRSAIMKRIEVTFINRNNCEQLLRKTDLGRNFNLHQSFICAGNVDGKDACLRDGGGPLICEIPYEAERYFQVGIVSWGVGCDQKAVPGVYTNVEKVNEWVLNELTKRNLDS